ncbi:MAG: DNA (cytosine-5-)-methyltransferase, partial [Alphaproteobacteria bacterium]
MRHMKVNSGKQLREEREKIGLSQAKLAEISNIPQHLLSAYELGKEELSEGYLKRLLSAIQDNDRLEEVLTRKKRYKNHTYKEVEHNQTRVNKHALTKENEEYTKLINSLRTNTVKKHKAISLFSGCGGLSLGFSWAGFDIKGFVEIDDGLREVYTDNFPTASLIGTDITKISQEQILTIKKKVGDLDVIIGGPPCQGFSLSGKRDVNDPRNSL